MNSARTQAVLLTPAGRGAVASILVQGPDALQAVAGLVRLGRRRSISEYSTGEIIYGRWAFTQGEDVVICRRDEGTIEIHCHGGVAASAAILEDLQQAGCELINWQDWIRRNSPNHLVAEAWIAVAEARTERTAAILLDQMNGALDALIRQVQLHLDQDDFAAAERLLTELLSRADLGMHLIRSWKVVLCGRPNVGKSNLINRLLGYERTIVFDQPGTTRDAITASTAIDGWPVDLTDTAGLRDSDDRLENAGIQRAWQQLSEADLVLLLFDAASPPLELIAQVKPAKTLLVRTKSDLAKPNRDGDGVYSTSAVTGEGLSELLNAISRQLVPTPPAAGSAVPFRPEDVAVISAALQFLRTKQPKLAHRLLADLAGGQTSIDRP